MAKQKNQAAEAKAPASVETVTGDPKSAAAPEIATDAAAEPEAISTETVAAVPDPTGLLATLRAASAAAQRDGQHAAHAVVEDFLQSAHALKLKADAAEPYLDGAAMDALTSLQAIL